MTEPTAARAIVAELVAAGVTHAFTVPGESFLGVLDALRDSPIRVVATRHEGGAAFAAEGFGKLARRPAVCLATRAVGAANLAIGIHTARQDSTPLLALLGQVATPDRGREAFQEIELASFLGTLSPYAVEPTHARDLAPAVREALRHTVSGRPGPACVALREDLLREPAGERADGTDSEIASPPAPDPPDGLAIAETARTALRLLRAAERPLLMLGVDVLAGAATPAAVELAAREGLGVVVTWRRPDAFPNDDPHYLGHPGLSALPCVRQTLAEAGLWVVVGDRLDENTCAGYTVPRPGTDVVHVWLDPAGVQPQGNGRGLIAPVGAFLDALLAASRADPAPPPAGRVEWLRTARARWEGQARPRPGAVAAGYVDQFAAAASLRRLLPPGAVLVTDAGNFSGWPARYLRFGEPGTFLGPVSGAMGYAVPAALGAKLARPDRPVVAVAGDGGFLMTAAELQTAAREGIDVTVVVYDNERYNTIRMHQERAFPGRPVATTLGASDLAGVARGLGAWAATARSIGEFDAALAAALAEPGPAVVVARCDPEQLAVGDADPR